VGKTSLIIRYMEDTFDSNIELPAFEFKLKTIDVDDDQITIELWDTKGQEKYRTVPSSYYGGAHAIIFVYDLSLENADERLGMWVSQSARYAKEDTLKLIVGNKLDLIGKANKEKIKEIINNYDTLQVEVSASMGTNMDKFDGQLKELCRRAMIQYK